MSQLVLPPRMAALRPKLGALVAGMEQSAPYAALLLSEKGGLQIVVDNREERVEELAPTAGTVARAANWHRLTLGYRPR